MVKEVSYIRLAIHQLKDILTQKKGKCKVNIKKENIAYCPLRRFNSSTDLDTCVEY